MIDRDTELARATTKRREAQANYDRAAGPAPESVVQLAEAVVAVIGPYTSRRDDDRAQRVVQLHGVLKALVSGRRMVHFEVTLEMLDQLAKTGTTAPAARPAADAGTGTEAVG